MENYWRLGCFFYVTDGYAVYPQFIDELDHIVSKPSMTRVEGENTRLRHYLARKYEKNFMLFKICRNVNDFYQIASVLPET